MMTVLAVTMTMMIAISDDFHDSDGEVDDYN